jgi:hypothetical protein
MLEKTFGEGEGEAGRNPEDEDDMGADDAE